MRIIAGKYKGRKIEFGKDLNPAIRPTSDFAREAIFNILTHGRHGLNGHTFEDKAVLDVFCGTGAFGLEALSRGAAQVTFIDSARDSLSIARHNVERLGEQASAEFLFSDATQLPKARRPYDLIFLDPPYYKNLVPPSLKSLQSGGWIAKDGVLIAEHDEKEKLELPAEFTSLDSRRYGRAVVELLKMG